MLYHILLYQMLLYIMMILSKIIIYHILLCIVYLYIRRTSNVACWLQTKRTLGMIDRRRDWRSPHLVWYARHLAQLEKIIMFRNSSHVMYYILCFVLCTKKWKVSFFVVCFYNCNYHSPLYFKHFHYIWQVLFSPHAKFKHLHVRPCTNIIMYIIYHV